MSQNQGSLNGWDHKMCKMIHELVFNYKCLSKGAQDQEIKNAIYSIESYMFIYKFNMHIRYRDSIHLIFRAFGLVYNN